MPVSGKRENLTGCRFGRLKVIKLQESKKLSRDSLWECLCDCGSLKITSYNNLKSGDTQSCGCLRGYTAHISGKQKTGVPLSDETKKKIGNSNRGKAKPLRTAEHSKNLGFANRGKKASGDTKKKMSIAHIGQIVVITEAQKEAISHTLKIKYA